MAKGSNKKALELQEAGLAETRLQNQRMNSLSQEQLDLMKNQKIPTPETPGAAPTKNSASVERAALDMRQKAQRRKGLGQTTYAGNAA